jgi:hypothetical protein
VSWLLNIGKDSAETQRVQRNAEKLRRDGWLRSFAALRMAEIRYAAESSEETRKALA